MLEISNVQLALDAGLADGETLLLDAAARTLGVDAADVRRVCVLKRSVDARKKSNVRFVATLGVDFADATAEGRALAAADERGGAGLVAGTHVKHHRACEPLHVPDCSAGFAASGEPRPVVVGTGPAGLFAALYLARAGLRPLVLERGADVDGRLAAVDAFKAGGRLDTETNIQFGEGGAGTFSDGKLTTNVKNPLAAPVLRVFVEAGAPEEILWQAKPHIGTDLLVGVVRRLREQIEEAGGEVRFRTRLSGLRFECGVLAGIELHDGLTGAIERIAARRVVLACGHSARDTFSLLHESGVVMEQKPFSVGVRIEHAQYAIDRAQYGEAASHPALGPADYKLAVHLPSGRGVYTFCMCPGGEVVCAASEEGGVVVNGMSRFARDGANANSALLVGVGPDDFEGDHPLAGIELQRSMERAAFDAAEAAGGAPFSAPAQTVGDFLACSAGGRRAAGDVAAANASDAAVDPTYARGVVWCDLHECLPPFVAEALAQALPLLDARLRGFAEIGAVMTGVETRSSSPVRIVRDEGLQAFVGAGMREAAGGGITSASGVDTSSEAFASPGSGLYPCGEGAGYAGGIMSAACDGLRVAQALARDFGDRYYILENE